MIIVTKLRRVNIKYFDRNKVENDRKFEVRLI